MKVSDVLISVFAISLLLPTACKQSGELPDTKAQTNTTPLAIPFEGKWQDGPFEVEVADGFMAVFANGEPFEYPNRKVAGLRPGVIELELKDGTKEIFVYEWDGEKLMMKFERSGPVYVSPVDEKARESAKLLEPNQGVDRTPEML